MLEVFRGTSSPAIVSLRSQVGIGGCDSIVGDGGGYVIFCHDALHTANVLIDVVRTILARLFQPICSTSVELALVISREPRRRSSPGFKASTRVLFRHSTER